MFDAAANGVLSSATIMANMPGFDEAVRGASALPHLGIGVHLNILRGAPLSDPAQIPTLVGADGKFFGSVRALWWRFMRGAIDPAHIEHELAAQIRKVIDRGIIPTHVDGEKHLHIFFPQMWDVVCRVAARANIARIRITREKLAYFSLPVRPHIAQIMKTALLNNKGMRCARVADRYHLRYCDRFFGLALTGKMTADVYTWFFKHCAPGTTEIMCHPARSAGAATHAGESSWLDLQRVAEYQALLDPRVKDALARSGAQLINYGEL